MTEHVRITDVSPRDGLQNEPGVVPTADKVRLIEALAAAGVDEIEATSFVSAKWVPQLGDAEAVLSAVREAGWFGPRAVGGAGVGGGEPPLPGGEGEARPRTLGSLSGGRGEERPPVLSVLVPNEKGFERALAFHSPEFPLKIAVFTAASETFNRKNTNATIEESIERFRSFLPRAIDAGMPVRFYVSCAIACPYEGPIAPMVVRQLCDQLMTLAPGDWFSAGRAEIDLGDTIGAGSPESIRALLGEFDEPDRARLVLHLHDTFGRAAECVRVALDAGVRAFDGSVAGLGGCPYAGTRQKPAPGNIATETLVRAVHDAGFTTGVDLDALVSAAALAREIVGKARSSAV